MIFLRQLIKIFLRSCKTDCVQSSVRRMYIDIDGREWDCCFSVRENLTQLREVNIENNTLCEEGLMEALSTFIS